MVTLVFSLISQDHNCLKTIPGKNSVLISESGENISGSLYKILKNLSGNTFTQCLNTNNNSFFLFASISEEGLFHHLEMIPEYSGKVINISEIKSLMIL